MSAATKSSTEITLDGKTLLILTKGLSALLQPLLDLWIEAHMFRNIASRRHLAKEIEALNDVKMALAVRIAKDERNED